MSKNFKPGQRVVFKNGHLTVNRHVINPNENEVVTILRVDPRIEYCPYVLLEYPRARDGVVQGFSDIQLFPLEEPGISLTMYRAELSELKPKEVLERTIELNLLQKQ